jgi:arylsulfatase A-like enzyme
VAADIGDLPRSRESGDRPNILFIITDDQERRQFNFLTEGRDANGKPRNLTPNLDQLAARGVGFANQYVTSPVCTPSRFTCLTGMYASRANDFRKVIAKGEQVGITWNSHVDPRTPNLARILQDAGYFTGGVGKNHFIQDESRSGFKVPYDRSAREPEVAAILRKKQAAQIEAYKNCGFDFAASIFQGNLGHGHNTQDTSYHNMDWITQGAMNFFDSWSETEKPFFLWFATTLDHGPGPNKRKYTSDPLSTPAGFLESPLTVQPPRDSLPRRVKQAGLDPDSTACDILWLDDALGALLERLRECGQLENTIIFYFNDHGVEQGKGSLYEGGIRSVSLVSGSSKYIKQPGRVSDVAISNVDFVPTILDLCNVKPPQDYKSDGRSFVSALQGDESPVHDYLYFEIGATRAILQDGWKYLAFRISESAQNMSQALRAKRNPKNPDAPFTHLGDRPGGRGSERPAIAFYPNYYDTDQLYHVAEDPTERNNLIDDPDQQERLVELRGLLKNALSKVPGPFAEFKP